MGSEARLVITFLLLMMVVIVVMVTMVMMVMVVMVMVLIVVMAVMVMMVVTMVMVVLVVMVVMMMVMMVVVMLMMMMMVIPWQNSSSVTVTDCQNTKTYVETSFSSQPSLVGHEKNLIGCLSLERAWGHILGQAWK